MDQIYHIVIKEFVRLFIMFFVRASLMSMLIVWSIILKIVLIGKKQIFLMRKNMLMKDILLLGAGLLHQGVAILSWLLQGRDLQENGMGSIHMSQV